MKIFHYLLFIFGGIIITSCSDAEIVSGTFHGKLYHTDTIPADIKITRINDGIIRMDVTSPAINGGYVEYAQLEKDADEAFSLQWYSDHSVPALLLSGYYFQGALSFDSWDHQYKFSGNKE